MTTPNVQRPYQDAFASLYDRLMSGKKYAAWDALIAEVVRAYSVPTGEALDVACGTGTISGMLARQGFKPIGIDLSEPMLREARNKVPSGAFFQADMRDFELAGHDSAALAVCFYDSLNYLLTDEDMRATFKCVKRHLAPGGVFLFDMNTRDHVAASQNNKPRVFDWDDSFVTFRFDGQERIWTMEVDAFAKQADGTYRHTREWHTERGYDEGDILPLLRDAGFRHLETRVERKTYENGLELPSRLYFVAKA